MADLTAGSLFNVNDMVFVITGAGSGIGAMMAKALASNGAAKVYIIGRRLEKLEETAKSSKNIIPVQCDVTSKESLSAAVAKIKEESDFVNAVIANSGIAGPTLQGMPSNPTLEQFQEFLWKIPAEDIDSVFSINTTSVLYTCLAFLPLLHAGNNDKKSPGYTMKIRSQFISTSSIAAFNRRATAGFAYGASKAAQTHLIKMLAHYLAPYLIRTNTIAPGLYASEMTEPFFEGKDPTEEGFMPTEAVPLRRYGTNEDMAGAILFLCSKAGAYVDSNVLITDGGRLSVMPGTY